MIAAVLHAQSHWPAQLETDVKAQSWDAAVRVGAAIVEEIDAGRMFARFADVTEEVRIRRMYADALDQVNKADEARRQRAIATAVAEKREGSPGYDRRMANLKASVLASAIEEPSSLPRSAIVVFWAKWCAVCKPELDALARYKGARVVPLDVDHLEPAMRKYVPMESLQSADLPQLYVVDPEGRIRFHVVGFEDDGFFARKLDWMVQESGLKPQAD